MAKSKNGANTTHDASRPPRRSKAAEYEYELRVHGGKPDCPAPGATLED